MNFKKLSQKAGNRLLYFALGILVFFGAVSTWGAWSDDVTTGDDLSANLWNGLKDVVVSHESQWTTMGGGGCPAGNFVQSIDSSGNVVCAAGGGIGVPQNFCVFSDTAAGCPAGDWTEDISFNDRTIRGINAGGGDSPGTNGGTNANHNHTTGNHTLTVPEMPAHDHDVRAAENSSQNDCVSTKGGVLANCTWEDWTNNAGGGLPHNHGNTGNASHVDAYRDVIVCCCTGANCGGGGGGGSSVWSLNGSDAYYTAGNVGIGTNNPGPQLDIVNGSSDANVAIYGDESNSSIISFITSRAGNGILGTANASGWAMYARGGSYASDPYDFGLTFWNGVSWLTYVPLNIDAATGVVGLGYLPFEGPGPGPVYWLGAGNVGWLTAINPSSEEYKENIEPVIDLGENRLLDMELKSFTWKDSGADDIGFIAEEVKEVLPELYQESENTKGYEEDKLIFYVIELLKSQEEEIDRQREQIAELSREIELLK